jgi:predicted RNA binding protein YcfA (HicA-like mRNA interferase family)
MKYSEVERKLKNAGCYWVKNGARHPEWYSPITNNYFRTSYHKNEETTIGTLKSISKISGIKF